MLRFLLFLAFITSLNAAEQSWYNKIYPEIEAGMHFSDFDGTISNAYSESDFREDYDYTETASSYFALSIYNENDYMPNIVFSYFNAKQNEDSDLNSQIYVADGVFDANDSVSTTIDYQVLNIALYQDLKIKGRRVKFLFWKFYPGDIEFDVGMNLKVITWEFQAKDAIASNPSSHWITVDSQIPLPYLGSKYYYYDFRAYANVSALSFSEAKSTNYEVGFDYKVIKHLFLSASYMYEDFKATEKKDTIEFKTRGNKFSFKYVF